MCAPPRTCRRAISLASSHFSSATKFLKSREPITFVRSPTSNGRVLSSASIVSIPEYTARCASAGRTLGFLPSTIWAIARMCFSVVPQHPPMKFNQPWSTNFSSCSASVVGVSKYLETPTTLAEQLEKFVDHGWLNFIGGCCGTTEKHIRAIAQMVEGKKPRVRPAEAHRAVYSGIETIEAEESTRPLLVGERTNVIGSRLFKNLGAEEKGEEGSEIARRQGGGGGHIVDLGLQGTERE